MKKWALYDDIEDTLLVKSEDIATRVAAMGKEITEDYNGESIVAVCILKGAVVFFSDLIRQIDLPLSIDFMAISSYGVATKSSGVVKTVKDLDHDIVGKHVLVVEDIIDSGLTLSYLRENLMQRGAKSLKICTLLDKPSRRKANLHVDYSGFEIPDQFVVGYGLDYAEKYRNLPDIGVLKPEIYSE